MYRRERVRKIGGMIVRLAMLELGQLVEDDEEGEFMESYYVGVVGSSYALDGGDSGEVWKFWKGRF